MSRPTERGPANARAGRWRSVPASRAGQRGATLIELVVMIVVVGIAAVTLVGAAFRLAPAGAGALVQTQALAAAQSLLDEAMAQPAPDGDAVGPETGEARGDATSPFNHVNDYHGYETQGVRALDGSVIPGLEAYAVRMSVQPSALGNVPAADGWWVRVEVQGPDGAQAVLAGLRVRLAD